MRRSLIKIDSSISEQIFAQNCLEEFTDVIRLADSNHLHTLDSRGIYFLGKGEAIFFSLFSPFNKFPANFLMQSEKEKFFFSLFVIFFCIHNLYIHSEINIAVEGVFYMPIRLSRVPVRQFTCIKGTIYRIMCFSYVLCFTHFILYRHRFEIQFLSFLRLE